jgi:hypothetical protein
MTAVTTSTTIDRVNGSGNCRLGHGRVKDNGGERSEEIHWCVVLGWCSEMLVGRCQEVLPSSGGKMQPCVNPSSFKLQLLQLRSDSVQW